MITKISLQNKKSPWVGMRYEDWLARTFLIKNPCVYREHTICIPKWPVKAGLSLCVQGTPVSNIDGKVTKRFIPVHTGNTVGSKLTRLRTAVYPCAYREHVAFAFQAPLVRRFIPVHTGNTGTSSIPSLIAAVYPCAYREHVKKPQILLKEIGLSLCIQGTLR